MQETVTELASKARKTASMAKDSISEYAQSAADIASDAAKRGAETASTFLEQEDVKVMTEKGMELGKKGAEEIKKLAIWAASIESVKRSVGGGVVGALVFGLAGTMLPGSLTYNFAKFGFAVGLVIGFVRK